jgi:hypothetical protein
MGLPCPSFQTVAASSRVHTGRLWLGYLFFVGLLVAASSSGVLADDSESVGMELQLEFTMPGVTTSAHDEYWCLNIELPAEPLNLVAIDPLARQGVVHHMLIYGCAAPAVSKQLYRCGMQTQGTCKGGVSSPLYGWGKNAPGLRFPEGVGIQVGPGTTNAMLNPQGDFCFNCGNAFHRSFLTFEHLPLVEFELEDGVSDAEAIALLDEEPSGEATAPKPQQPKTYDSDNPDVLRLDEPDLDIVAQVEMMEDPWQGQMMIPNQPIRASRRMLKNIPRSEVCFVVPPHSCRKPHHPPPLLPLSLPLLRSPSTSS